MNLKLLISPARWFVAVYTVFACQQLSASENFCKRAVLGVLDLVSRTSIRQASFEVLPGEGFNMTDEIHAEVNGVVLELQSSLYRLYIPNGLAIYITADGSRSYYDPLVQRIVSVPEPAILLHEIGHAVFKSSLQTSKLSVVSDLYDYEKRRMRLKRQSRSVQQSVHSAMRELGTEFNPAAHPDYIAYEKYQRLELELYDEYKHIKGLQLSRFWTRYEELFADTLVYAFTGNSSAISDTVERLYPQSLSKAVHSRARSFKDVISPEVWPNTPPYNNVQNYFGPVKTEIGIHLKGVRLNERMLALDAIYRVLLEDIQSQFLKKSREVDLVDALEDISADNIRLIHKIRLALAEKLNS